jgi:hypothetical protein
MKHVTVNELADILLAFKTVHGMPIMAGITQLTDISNMRKTNNPYVGAKKLTTMQIFLNSDYKKGVENRLVKEGKDISEYEQGANTMPLVFGDNNQFIGMFFSKKTGKYEYVLQMRPNDNSTPQVKYLLNGQEIAKELISPFIPERKKAENQGTDNEILWRKVYMNHILNLNFNKEQYQLIHTV